MITKQSKAENANTNNGHKWHSMKDIYSKLSPKKDDNTEMVQALPRPNKQELILKCIESKPPDVSTRVHSITPSNKLALITSGQTC